MRRGKTLKGSKHSCGFPAPPDDKNPAAILLNLFINSSLVFGLMWQSAKGGYHHAVMVAKRRIL